LSIFLKPVEKTQVSLKSYENKGYFTRKRMYLYDDISLILLGEMLQTEVVEN